MKNFEAIKYATEVSNKWTNREVIWFHYTNPNGLYAAKQSINDKISTLVDAGACNPGAFIAYGTLNSIDTDWLSRLASNKRVKTSDMRGVLGSLRFTIQCAEKFIAECQATSN